MVTSVTAIKLRLTLTYILLHTTETYILSFVQNKTVIQPTYATYILKQSVHAK